MDNGRLTDTDIELALGNCRDRLDIPAMADAVPAVLERIRHYADAPQRASQTATATQPPVTLTEGEPAAAQPSSGEEPASSRTLDTPRSRSRELLGIAGAALALALIGGILVIIFQDQQENIEGPTPGANVVPTPEPYQIEGYEFVRAIGGPSFPNQPADTVVGPDGTIYVADVELNRVLAFNQDGELKTSWGNGGMSEELAGPLRLALDSDGNLYVVEYYGSSVQKFDPSGSPITSWSLSEENRISGGAVRSTQPFGIVIDQDDNVYVAERDTKQIEKFDSTGQLLDTWELNIGRIHDIAIDGQDRIYLPGENMRVLDTEGEIVTEWETGAMTLTIRNGTVYALVQTGPEEDFAFKIARFDLDGTVTSEVPVEVASPITRTNIFVSPGVADDGNVYLGDPGAQRIVAFDQKGNVVREITGEHNQSRFTGLTDVKVDEDGNVYGIDPLLGRVQKFTPDGEHLASMNFESGRGRSMSTAFEWADAAIAEDGTVYVADKARDHITVFSPSGEKIDEWGRFGIEPGDETLQSPVSIALGGQGHLYVLERPAGRVKKFTTDGEFIWSNTGTTDNLLDITVADSTVYVLSGAAVQTFDLEGNPLDVITRFNTSRENPDDTRIVMHLTVDQEGNSYITALRFLQDLGAVEIEMRKLSPDGELLQTSQLWQYDMYETPIAVAGRDGKLYLTDPANKRILVYEPAS